MQPSHRSSSNGVSYSSNGISVVAATSHAEPGRAAFPLETYRARLREAQEYCVQEHLNLTVVEGSEVLYADAAPRLIKEGLIPLLGRNQAVLVEFSPDVEYERIYQAVRKLGNTGHCVIIAHAERYECLRQVDRLVDLKESLGAMIQLNCSTLIAPHGFKERRWLDKVMRYNLCDVAASDAHNVTTRPCRMGRCFDTLASTWGDDVAYRLCVSTPSTILGLDPIDGV